MAIKMHIVPKDTRRKVYVLSDSPLSDTAKTVEMTDEQFVAYHHAKAEYEKWQRKLAYLSRHGWVPSWL